MAWYKEIAPFIGVEQNIFDDSEIVSYRMTDDDKEYWEAHDYKNPKVYLVKHITYDLDKNNNSVVSYLFVLTVGDGAGKKTVATGGDTSSNELIDVTEIFNKFKTAKTLRKHVYQIISEYTDKANDDNQIFQLVKKNSDNFKGYYPSFYYLMISLGEDYPEIKNDIQNVLKSYEDDLNGRIKLKLPYAISAKKKNLKAYQENPDWYNLLSKKQIKDMDKKVKEFNHEWHDKKWNIDSPYDTATPYQKMIDGFYKTLEKIIKEQKLQSQIVDDFENKFKKKFDKEFSKGNDTFLNALVDYHDYDDKKDKIKQYLESRNLITKSQKLNNLYSVGTLSPDTAKRIDDILSNLSDSVSDLSSNLKASNEQLVLKINPKEVAGVNSQEMVFYIDTPNKIISQIESILTREGMSIYEAPKFMTDNKLVKMKNVELMIIKNDNNLKDELNKVYLDNYQKTGKIALDALINQSIIKHAKPFTLSKLFQYFDLEELEGIRRFRKYWDEDDFLSHFREEYIEEIKHDAKIN